MDGYFRRMVCEICVELANMRRNRRSVGKMLIAAVDLRLGCTLVAFVCMYRYILKHAMFRSHGVTYFKESKLFYKLTYTKMSVLCSEYKCLFVWPCNRSWWGSTSASWWPQSWCAQTIWKRCQHLWKQAGNAHLETTTYSLANTAWATHARTNTQLRVTCVKFYTLNVTVSLGKKGITRSFSSYFPASFGYSFKSVLYVS